MPRRLTQLGAFAACVLAMALPSAARAAGPVGDIRVTDVGPLTVTVSWTLAKPAKSWVEFGHLSPYGTWWPGTRRADGRYEARVRGLSPGIEYRLKVVTKGGNEQASFRTALVPERTSAAARNGVITLDGAPFFPIMTWSQCPETYDRMLGLGTNLFLGPCDYYIGGASQLATLAGRGYQVLPAWEAGVVEGRGVIGWNYQDEPDGFGVVASQLPNLPHPDQTGRLRFLTLTNHFYSGSDPISDVLGKEIYPPYFAKADVLGFDIYPLQKYCGSPWINLEDVYTAQRELADEHVPGKPTYQWIETGGLEEECSHATQVSPATMRAEVWLAIAGGARGIGYFTHTFKPPTWAWNRYDVTPAIETAIAKVNAEVRELAPALLGKEASVRLSPSRTPVRAGIKLLNGALYMIAVNSDDTTVDAVLEAPQLGRRTLAVYGERRNVRARYGTILDRFPPHAVHIYIAPPLP